MLGVLSVIMTDRAVECPLERKHRFYQISKRVAHDNDDKRPGYSKKITAAMPEIKLEVTSQPCIDR